MKNYHDSGIILRNVTNNDARFIWDLANDPQVREVSFSSAEIPWTDHQKWFDKKLQDKKCHFYIVEDGDRTKIGQIRFELKEEGWVISLSIVKEFRGKGLGAEVISAGSELLFNTVPNIDKINAYIKHENIASKRVFEKAGFIEAGNASINETNDAVLMILSR